MTTTLIIPIPISDAVHLTREHRLQLRLAQVFQALLSPRHRPLSPIPGNQVKYFNMVSLFLCVLLSEWLFGDFAHTADNDYLLLILEAHIYDLGYGFTLQSLVVEAALTCDY